jgi:hypothetical protein
MTLAITPTYIDILEPPLIRQHSVSFFRLILFYEFLRCHHSMPSASRVFSCRQIFAITPFHFALFDFTIAITSPAAIFASSVIFVTLRDFHFFDASPPAFSRVLRLFELFPMPARRLAHSARFFAALLLFFRPRQSASFSADIYAHFRVSAAARSFSAAAEALADAMLLLACQPS